jgi:integrase
MGITMPYRHYGRWRARWLDENGKPCSKTFASRRDATYHEQKKKAEATEIRTGLRSAAPPLWTFPQLWDRWSATRGATKRSRSDDVSIANRHLLPFFGALAVREIVVEHGDRYVAEHASLSKKTVANHLTLLIAMLNFARDLGWIDRVPRIKKPRVRIHGKDFAFLRTLADVRRFLEAAKNDGDVVFALYATAVYTGARAGELAGLRWEDVDFDRRLITLQRSFDGPTKADDVRYVPILDALLPILRAWRLRNPLPVVFPNQAGRMLGESSRVFQEVLHRVLGRAGFPRAMRNGKDRPYIRFHDLRHTFASHWVMGGGSIFKLQKVLGHKSVQMTMRYAHLAPDAFVEDYGRLAAAAPATAAILDLVADNSQRAARVN